MDALPPPPEVLAHLAALADSNYDQDARGVASDWATPILIDAETLPLTEPPALQRALFLLGAADLMGDFEHFVYGPEDFEEARRELGDWSG